MSIHDRTAQLQPAASQINSRYRTRGGSSRLRLDHKPNVYVKSIGFSRVRFCAAPAWRFSGIGAGPRRSPPQKKGTALHRDRPTQVRACPAPRRDHSPHNSHKTHNTLTSTVRFDLCTSMYIYIPYEPNGYSYTMSLRVARAASESRVKMGRERRNVRKN